MDLNPTSQKNRVRKRFSSTRYIFSKAGIPKILSIILFLVAGILDLSASGPQCSEAAAAAGGDSSAKPPDLLFPLLAVSSAAVSALTYAVFAIGCAKRILALWVPLDMAACTLLAVGNLIVAVLLLTQCPPNNSVQAIPAPLSLVASALLVVCAASTYYMWRYLPEEPAPQTPSSAAVTNWRIPGVARGSIFNLEVERNAFEL